MPSINSILQLITASIILLGTTSGVHINKANTPAAPKANIPWVGSEISVTQGADGSEPAVAYNWKRKEYLVVWRRTEGIYGQRINISGELVGPTNFEISTDSFLPREPAVAYDPVNERYFIVWRFDASGDAANFDISGRLIPWKGPSLNFKEFKVNTFGTDQINPKVAYNNADREFLVVWTDGTSDQIYGARVDAFKGDLLGGEKAITSILDTAGGADVAFNSNNGQYMLVWGKWKNPPNYTDIHGLRLKGDDITPLGGGEIGIATWPSDESSPAAAVCKDSNQYLVPWVSSSGTDIYGRIVLGDGTISTVHHLSDTDTYESLPDVACDFSGKLFLSVWRQAYTIQAKTFGIWGSLVSAEGGGSLCPGCGSAPETPDEMYPAFEIIGPNNEFHSHSLPAVAGGDNQYMATYESTCAAASCYPIQARIIYLLNKPPVYKYLPFISKEIKK